MLAKWLICTGIFSRQYLRFKSEGAVINAKPTLEGLFISSSRVALTSRDHNSGNPPACRCHHPVISALAPKEQPHSALQGLCGVTFK